MNMQPGVRLGPYEMLSPLRAGGMGEVWRARDSRLDRDVAIKILPAGLATDGMRFLTLRYAEAGTEEPLRLVRNWKSTLQE